MNHSTVSGDRTISTLFFRTELTDTLPESALTSLVPGKGIFTLACPY
jgi:hypothetical protein